MKCPKCGEELNKKDKFCGKCGANIEQELNERVKNEAKAKEEAEREAEEKIKKEAEKREENKNEKEVNAEISDPAIGKEVEKIKKEYNEKQVEERVVKKEIKKNKQINNANFQKKENTKTKKKHTALKAILIFIMIIVLIIGVTYGLYEADVLPDQIKEIVSPVFEKIDELFNKDQKEEKNENENTENTTENTVETKEVQKIINNKDLVYDSYVTELENKTSRIPTINLNYKNVENINNEITNFAESKLKEAENITTKDKSRLVNVDYRWYQNEEVLSLVIVLRYANDINKYYVFNVNVYDGEDVQNSRILDMAKVSSEDFISKCVSAATDYFDKLYDQSKLTDIDENAYNQARDNTIQETNFSSSRTQMYLNDNGELMIIARIYTLSAEQDEKNLNLERYSNNVVNSNSSNIVEPDENTIENNVSNETTDENEVNNTNSNDVESDNETNSTNSTNNV